MTRVAKALRGATLSFKLVVFGALLTAVVVGSAFLPLSLVIRGTTKRLLAWELSQNLQALIGLQNQGQQQLLWTSSVITEHPTLRAAMETYRLESVMSHSPQAELLATIQHEVEGIVAGLGRDLLVITDDHGRVLAASERRGIHPTIGQDLSSLKLIRHALDGGDSTTSSLGVARFGDVFFQVGSVPIVLRGIPIGVLLLGDRLDEAYVSRLRAALGGALVVVANSSQVIASSFPTASRDPAPFRRAEPADSGARAATVRLGEYEYVTAPMTLGRDESGDRVVLYLLHPLSETLGPLNRSLLLSFLVFGVLAVLLAGLGAGLVSRSLMKPIRSFVGFMESVAQSGDYSHRFDAKAGAVEVQTLNASYDRLIDSLAQKHAQLEQRTVELSQANVSLREEMRERGQAEQALRFSEQQLRQSQKLEAVGTLAGGVAHDFNNLLTVIGSYTDLVMAELDENSPLLADLEQVRQAADRASGLTAQLLAFSRKQVMQPKVLDLSGVLGGIEKMLRRVIGEDIELKTIKEPNLSTVKADPGQIGQVLLNLAVNARDAMPQGGTLTLQTANIELTEKDPDRNPMMAPGRWVMLAVTDTGSGMDEATRARIFEPFFTTKGPGKGTGLGLSTVYGIVKQSGGFIWVESELGRGTSFKVYLPAVDEVEDEADWTAEPTEATGGTETILLVEDERPVRALVRRCLERAGYAVLESDGPTEALRLTAQHEGMIHLLLTDVVMPQMSGKQLAERVATLRPGTRVLYMSGYTDDTVAQHGVLDAGTMLIQKPFTPENLAAKVRAVLDAPPRDAEAVSPGV
jgi:signal transduction histidine kinase/ActR/RegA family two-component response regulator